MNVPEVISAPSTFRWRNPFRRPVNARWVQLLFYIGLFGGWELLAHSGLWPSYLFPAPSQVALKLWAGLTKGVFITGAVVSLKHLLLGYLLSLSVGMVLGLLIGRIPLLSQTLGTLMMGLQALPSVCWLPLSILWFGLNEQAIIFVVIMGALFSITLGVETGVKNTSPQYLRAARNLGAQGLALYTQVILPSALPTIVSGLKQGWAFAWRSLMAAELLYYSLSLGNLLQTGRDLNDVAQVMAVMLVIIFVGVLFNWVLFAPVEKRLRQRWGWQQE